MATQFKTLEIAAAYNKSKLQQGHNPQREMLEAEVTSYFILYVHSTEPWLNTTPRAKTTFLSSSRWMPRDFSWHSEHLFRQNEAQRLI